MNPHHNHGTMVMNQPSFPTGGPPLVELPRRVVRSWMPLDEHLWRSTWPAFLGAVGGREGGGREKYVDHI